MQYFARVFAINLDCRPDRWASFKERVPADWPFEEIVRCRAIDGRLSPPPDWWKGGPGAWGCFRTHLKIIEECLTQDIDSVLILEDDALFVDDFAAKCGAFFEQLPNDWGFVYLGGQHLQQHIRLPRMVNEQVYRPFNINRTHGYGLRGRAMMEAVYKHLTSSEWTTDHHVDHHLGVLHGRLKRGLYAPREWLVLQDGGVSNITGRDQETKLFKGAEELLHGEIDLRMVPVVGPYRGGTSCVAGILHKLGVDMGESFAEPNEANPQGFYEASGLCNACRRSFAEPWLTREYEPIDSVNLLRKWGADRCEAVRETTTACGGKHPILSMLGPEILEAWGDPRFIVVDRPVEESVRSLKKLRWGWPDEAIEYVLPRMVETRDDFLRDYGPRHHRVSFKRLLLQPEPVIREMCDFLEYEPTDEQFQEALASVKRE